METTTAYESLKRQNETRLLEAERLGHGRVDAWPVDFTFEFTGACNLHCFMCGFEMLRDDLRSQGRSKFTIPVEQFRQIADKVFPHVRTINPTVGGEPLVLPYFEELVDKVAEYGCQLKIITNGMLLRGERLHKLMPHLASLTISFDGATKETFEYVRTGAKFEQVMENVAAFSGLRRELGLRDRIAFSFNVTLLQENVGELAQIVEIAAEHDVQLVSATFVIAANERVQASSPLNDPVATNAALARARLRASQLGIAVGFPAPLPVRGSKPVEDSAAEALVAESAEAEAPATATPVAARVSSGYPANWKGKYYCDMAWRRVFIGLDGEVFPCCSHSRPIMGNAFQQDFFDIWNSEEYQRLRTGLFTGDLTDYCRRCPLLQKSGALPFRGDAYTMG